MQGVDQEYSAAAQGRYSVKGNTVNFGNK